MTTRVLDAASNATPIRFSRRRGRHLRQPRRSVEICAHATTTGASRSISAALDRLEVSGSASLDAGQTHASLVECGGDLRDALERARGEDFRLGAGDLRQRQGGVVKHIMFSRK
jgi:hypothetical protein